MVKYHATQHLHEYNADGLCDSLPKCIKVVLATDYDATEEAFQGVLKDNKDLAEEVQRLQRALAFWMPHMPDCELPEEIDKRLEHDIWLLAGSDPNGEKGAEELGWIALRI